MSYPSRRQGRFSLASLFDPAPEAPVWEIVRLPLRPPIALRVTIPAPKPVKVEDASAGTWRLAA